MDTSIPELESNVTVCSPYDKYIFVLQVAVITRASLLLRSCTTGLKLLEMTILAQVLIFFIKVFLSYFLDDRGELDCMLQVS